MTNAVDILAVGGPAHGRVVCAPKPLTTHYEFPGVDQVYDRQVYDNRYHIIVPSGVVVDDATIAATIAATGFQPAWDLRPEPPVSEYKP